MHKPCSAMSGRRAAAGGGGLRPACGLPVSGVAPLARFHTYGYGGSDDDDDESTTRPSTTVSIAKRNVTRARLTPDVASATIAWRLPAPPTAVAAGA